MFNPHAPSNRHTTLSSCYRKHEQIKKRTYEQRCREVEHASFTPLVISATGGLANEASIFYKRLASMLASKWDHPYSNTLCWLRCRLGFSLFSPFNSETLLHVLFPYCLIYIYKLSTCYITTFITCILHA